MFTRKFDSDLAAIRFTFEGRPLQARAGDTVATALLANDATVFRRSAISDAPRAPYCMMGVCFECLVVIDGVSNRQACLIPIEEGMNIKVQNGPRHFNLDPADEAA